MAKMVQQPPPPPTNVTATPTGDTSAQVSWQGWAMINGPTTGPILHTIQLYLSAVGAAKVSVSINGAVQMTGYPVTGTYASKTEQLFTFNGTWTVPPQVVVTMPITAGAELYLNTVVYDGAILPNLKYHFITQGQYGFVV